MKEYTFQAHSGPVTVLLSDEEAAARGLKHEPAKKHAEPKPEPVEVAEEPEVKAKTPANKARTAANKRAALADQAFTKK